MDPMLIFKIQFSFSFFDFHFYFVVFSHFFILLFFLICVVVHSLLFHVDCEWLCCVIFDFVLF